MLGCSCYSAVVATVTHHVAVLADLSYQDDSFLKALKNLD